MAAHGSIDDLKVVWRTCAVGKHGSYVVHISESKGIL